MYGHILFNSFKVVSDSTNISNNEGSTDHRTTTLPSLGTSGVLNVKEENQSQPVMPPLLTPEGPDARVQGLNRSLSSEQQQNVQMFVVKEEDPLVLNEPQIIQQPSNGKRRNGDLCTSTGKWGSNIFIFINMLLSWNAFETLRPCCCLVFCGDLNFEKMTSKVKYK